MSLLHSAINIFRVKSHACHGISNHQQLSYLFNSFFRLTSKEGWHEHSVLLALWWNQQWPMDSPHKWPVKQKAFPCHDVIIRVEPLQKDHLPEWSLMRCGLSQGVIILNFVSHVIWHSLSPCTVKSPTYLFTGGIINMLYDIKIK